VLYPLSYEGGECNRSATSIDAMPDLTVLVVDDDPVIVRLLEVNFEMEGYAVITAGDGEEAVAKAAADAPDVVVCDIMMPKMNGLQVVEHLRGDDATKGIPVILLSAKAQASEIQRGLDAGADDYVTKPFDPLELVDRVRDVLEKSRK
jgi:DNA-binding response OmpR family regulator